MHNSSFFNASLTMIPVWMLFATFMFSIMSVCVKLVSETHTAIELVMYRSLVGLIVMICVILARKGQFSTKHIYAHLWRATVGATAFGLWFYAMGKLPLATSMTLNYMSPIWMAIILLGLSLFRGNTHFDWKLVGAIVASFIGVALLLRPTMQVDQFQWGVCGLISGILASLAYLQIRYLGLLGEPSERIVFYFCLFGTIGGAIACVVRAKIPGTDGIIWHALNLKSFGLILTLGLAAAVGQLALTRAYHHSKTLVTANLQYTGIIFSSIWGMLIWDDQLGYLGWTGIAVIVVSGIVATYYGATQKSAPKA